MEKHETVPSLFEKYVNQTKRKVIAIMYGDGMRALPDDITGKVFRYARLGKSSNQDLSDLREADCAIVDMHCINQKNFQILKRFLKSIKHDPNYLIITEANSELGARMVSLLEEFRPRLIVTSNYISNCA